MSEYINRDDLIKNLKTFAPEHYTPLIDSLIQKQPSADVRPVVRGEWIECFEDWRKQLVGDKCSICGFEHYGSHYNFCPNCGRDMRGTPNDTP